jgi:homoserine O-acetyltransferase
MASLRHPAPASGASQARSEADNPSSLVMRFGPERPLILDSGRRIEHLQIGYQVYGELNADRSNAILICHALTGDQHVASDNPVTGKPGWWEIMVGPGKPIDTDRYFVICSNVARRLHGHDRPASTDPATGKPYGLTCRSSPSPTWSAPRRCWSTRLGIDTLFCVVGGSMGGMQVLQWAVQYPDRVFSAMPIATARAIRRRTSPSTRSAARRSWPIRNGASGRYLVEDTSPRAGLAVARMAAHITYMSDAALHRKFGRKLPGSRRPAFGFDADFQIESYLRHQGLAFVERFDANSYLYVTRAMDYFDIAADYGGRSPMPFSGTKTRFCVVSFTSDWLFPTAESKRWCTR